MRSRWPLSRIKKASAVSLAQGVAMSPSRFAARFAATLAESPMAYIAKWRMNLACRLLSGTPQAVNHIAAEVGYENVAAFNRAFKKHVGIPPAAWRARESGGCERYLLRAVLIGQVFIFTRAVSDH